MKPVHFFLAMAGPIPVLSLVAAGAVPGVADSLSPSWDDLPEALAETHLAAAPRGSSANSFWIKISSQVSIKELAEALSLVPTDLAQLNQRQVGNRLQPGEWVQLPGETQERARQLASLNAGQIRRTAPASVSAPVASTGVVRFGDDLGKLAQRYGMRLQDLLQLNPGLQAASLVTGTQIRVANSSPARSRMVLGLNPVGSGGLSWPELPSFGGETEVRPAPTTTTWIWPAQGVFTSGFGWRWGRMHKGVDIASNVGTPIVAARSGRVSYAGWHNGGYGYLVEIIHDDGSKTLYGHNSRVMVRVGQTVAQGTKIAAMGSTGRSTGPHLHFEIHPAGSGAANPLQFLPGRA